MIATMMMTMTSCATITTAMHGGTRNIFLEGEVNEPITVKTSHKTYYDVTLPTKVKISAYRIDEQKINITSRHYRFDDIILKGRLNPMVVCNVLIGGLIGIGVDLAAGTTQVPAQNKFQVVPSSSKFGDNNSSNSQNSITGNNEAAPDSSASDSIK